MLSQLMNINAKKKYSWFESNALYMVGLTMCNLLKLGRDNYWRLILEITYQIEWSIREKISRFVKRQDK